jgi:hypothetical protein
MRTELARAPSHRQPEAIIRFTYDVFSAPDA